MDDTMGNSKSVKKQETVRREPRSISAVKLQALTANTIQDYSQQQSKSLFLNEPRNINFRTFEHKRRLETQNQGIWDRQHRSMSPPYRRTVDRTYETSASHSRRKAFENKVGSNAISLKYAGSMRRKTRRDLDSGWSRTRVIPSTSTRRPPSPQESPGISINLLAEPSGSKGSKASKEENSKNKLNTGLKNIKMTTDVTIDPNKVFANKNINTAEYKPYEYPPIKEEDPDQPTPLNLDECFKIISCIVEKAGLYVYEANNQRIEYITKQHIQDLQTRIDKEVEQMIVDQIHAKFPTHRFIAEEAFWFSNEGFVELTDDPTWIIDPIDGTMNFVHRFPFYAISVALFVNKQPKLGVIYNPARKEFFTAREGLGAFCNGVKISCSEQSNLKNALIIQDYCSNSIQLRSSVLMQNANKLLKTAHGLRSIGSSAVGLTMVANGTADAFYYFGLHIWDMAAGMLLVKEAGGVLIDPAGGKFDVMSRRILAASTNQLAMDLSRTILQYYPEPRDDQPKATTIFTTSNSKNLCTQTEFSDSCDENENDKEEGRH